MTRAAHLIATVLYVGHLRPAPGTWGSLAALPLAWGLWQLGGMWLFLLTIPAAFAAGLWATRVYTARGTDSDPSEVVIDEVVGQWIALAPVMVGAQAAGQPVLALYPGWIAAFALFRLFDVWKPLMAGRADRRGDAMGVMLDDIWAGLFAAVITLGLAGLSHVVIAP
jgi:phosphatidylglycerophosphatase A